MKLCSDPGSDGRMRWTMVGVGGKVGSSVGGTGVAAGGSVGGRPVAGATASGGGGRGAAGGKQQATRTARMRASGGAVRVWRAFMGPPVGDEAYRSYNGERLRRVTAAGRHGGPGGYIGREDGADGGGGGGES